MCRHCGTWHAIGKLKFRQRFSSRRWFFALEPPRLFPATDGACTRRAFSSSSAPPQFLCCFSPADLVGRKEHLLRPLVLRHQQAVPRHVPHPSRVQRRVVHERERRRQGSILADKLNERHRLRGDNKPYGETNRLGRLVHQRMVARDYRLSRRAVGHKDARGVARPSGLLAGQEADGGVWHAL